MNAPVSRRANLLRALYEAAVALAGWGLLLVLTARASVPLPLLPGLGFLGLALILKREGLRVADRVTHSLAGLAVLAAVLALGPLTGAWVAALAGSLYLAWRLWGDAGQPGALRVVLFAGGVGSLSVLAASSAHRLVGGNLVPPLLQRADLLPLAVLSLAWAACDHAAWCLAVGLERGLMGLRAFLGRILVPSVAVELLPLPLSAVLAAAYRHWGTLAFVLLVAFLVATGELVRYLYLTLGQARARVSHLSTLGAFSRSLLAGGLDVAALCRLLQTHTAAVVEVRALWLGLCEGPCHDLTPVLQIAPPGSPDPTPDPSLLAWMREHPAPLLLRDTKTEPLPFVPTRNLALRSALYVPLQAADGPIGLLAVASDRPQAYDDEDLRTVATFANQTALAIRNARSYEAEQRRARQIATVGEVGRRVTAVMGMERLFTGVADLVREALGYYHVNLFTADAQTGALTFVASTSPLAQERGIAVEPGKGLIGWAAQTGEVLVVKDVAADPRYLPGEGMENTRSEAVVPLKIDERLVGVLDVQSDRPDAFSPDDIFVLQTLADQVAIAVEDARLYRAEKARRQLADTLRETAVALTSSLEIRALLELVLTHLQRVLRYDAAAILEATDGHYCLEAGRGAPYAAIDSCLTRQQDAELQRLQMEQVPIVFEGPGGRGRSLAVPLLAKGRLTGALLLERWGEGAGYSQEEIQVATTFASQAAAAFENARLYAAQQEEARVSTALLRVAEALANLTRIDDVLDAVISLVPLLVGVDRTFIFLRDEGASACRAVRAQGLAAEHRETLLGHSLDELAPDLWLAAQESSAPIGLDALGPALQSQVRAALGLAGGLALPLRAGGETIGLLVAGQTESPEFQGHHRRAILTGIANQAAMAIQNARLYQQSLEQERLAQELRVARQIQATFLPEETPPLPGWSVAVASRPAREVGGDFYDFIHLGGSRWGLVMADVSDKGVPAALFMALCRTVVRAVAAEGRPPAATLAHANDLLVADSRSGMFVTLCYGVLDHETGEFFFASGGHNPPFWYRHAGREVVRLACRGVALGVIERPVLEERRILLGPGDALVVYTDGVTETFDPDERLFGEEGLREAIARVGGRPAEGILASIDDATQAFARGVAQSDDYTLLVLRRDEA
ncbi:MAG: SpoIIE family protein phosphatase [Anaerolineae bacterium]